MTKLLYSEYFGNKNIEKFLVSPFTVDSNGEITAYTGTGGNIIIPLKVNNISIKSIANGTTTTGLFIRQTSFLICSRHLIVGKLAIL